MGARTYTSSKCGVKTRIQKYMIREREKERERERESERESQ